jgi:hypothetical protein
MQCNPHFKKPRAGIPDSVGAQDWSSRSEAFMSTHKLLIMGLPGSGKTSLARKVALRLNAVHFNADDIRREINKDLGFSEADRIEQARRMGWLCDQVVKAGCFAVADFICPVPQARAAFQKNGAAFIAWVDRISTSRFEDTNQMFVAPEEYDVRVGNEGTLDGWADQIVHGMRSTFDAKRQMAFLASPGPP